ncbi:MAG: class I SAM-dependent methyltransferase [Candidatus Hermodarchaeota archaeon]
MPLNEESYHLVERASNKSYNDLGVDGLKRITNDHRTGNTIIALEKYLTKEDFILDLGCGYGRLTIPLKIRGYRICGLDLSPHLLADARANTRKMKLDIEFKKGSMLDLSYENEIFDKIICMWLTYNHLLTKHDQMVALNEMYRVLKPGGLAIIELINRELESIKRELQVIGRGENNRVKPTTINNVVFYFYIHNENTFRRICEYSNFQEFYIKVGEFAYEPRILGLLYK